MDDVKIGAMISAANKRKAQTAHDMMVEFGAVCNAGKSASPDEVWVITGGDVKAMGDGKVGGYLIRFTTASDPDLTGDFFASSTDFGEAKSSPVLYQHGADKKLGRRKIGIGDLKVDELGVWIDAQLNLRDEYEKTIYELAQAGKLGWSSGTAGHLVAREPVGKANKITSWPLGLDASLTPTPAEPRNSAQIKSLFTEPEAVGETAAAATKSDHEEHEMEEIEIKKLIDAALEQERAAVKATEQKAAELKTAEDAGYKKAIEELTARKLIKTAPAYVKHPGDDSEGEMAFKSWVATGQTNGGLIVPDASYTNIKAQFNVNDGATGGYLVPDPLYNRIIAKRNLASWVRQAPCQFFQTDSDHVYVPAEDTSHHAFTSTAEGAAYHEDEGTLARFDLALIKYTKEVRMTESFVNFQATNFDQWLMQALGRAEAVTENTLATAIMLDGSGATAGTAAATATALTVAEMERLIGTLGGGYNVASECGFLMKNATKYYLKGVNFGTYQPWDFDGYPVYVSDDMPAMTASLYSTVFGNFSFFGVAEKPGMIIQRNPYLYMATGVVALFASIFRAYDVLQSEAFYKMAQSA
jgi:HK97 family phage major capsid protein